MDDVGVKELVEQFLNKTLYSFYFDCDYKHKNYKDFCVYIGKALILQRSILTNDKLKGFGKGTVLYIQVVLGRKLTKIL